MGRSGGDGAPVAVTDCEVNVVVQCAEAGQDGEADDDDRQQVAVGTEGHHQLMSGVSDVGI